MKQNKKLQSNYRTFYFLGLIFTGVGIPLVITTKNYWVLTMGVIFFIIGLINMNKWNKNPETIDKIKGFRKILVMILIVLSVIALSAALIMFIITIINLF